MKKLLVVLSMVMVLAFAGSAFAASGHPSTDPLPSYTPSVEDVNKTVEVPAAVETAVTGSTTSVGGTTYTAVSPTTVQEEYTVDTTSSTVSGITSAVQSSVNSDEKTVDSQALVGKTMNLGDAADTDALPAPAPDSVGTQLDAIADTNAGEGYTITMTIQVYAGGRMRDVTNGAIEVMQVAADGSTSTVTKPSDIKKGASTFFNVYAGLMRALLRNWSLLEAEVAADDDFTPVLVVSKVADDSGEDENGSLGGSGGGCAIGTSALGLAVLGLFIASRKK